MCYIALLAGGFDDIGQYSWGSVVLAHLFRQLCELTDLHRSDMGGCHILLQIWAWTRFPPIAPPLPQPTHPEWHFGHRFNGLARFKPQHQLLYRGTLDTLTRDEVVWQPYGDYHFLDIPADERYLWLARTPIICFYTVEQCQPDRCLRQFSLDQPIPLRPRKLKRVHDHTLRGKWPDNWQVKLRPFIHRWQIRAQHIGQLPPPLAGLMSPNHEYRDWYRLRGKRYPLLALIYFYCRLIGLEMLYFATTPEHFESFGLDWVHEEIGRLIFVFRESSRVEEPGSQAPPAQTQDEPQISLDIPTHRQEGRGLGCRREPVAPLPEPIHAPRPRIDMSGYFRPPMMGQTYDSQPIYYGPLQHQDVPFIPSQTGTHGPPMDPRVSQCIRLVQSTAHLVTCQPHRLRLALRITSRGHMEMLMT
ncbi:protein MAIN-LIKE 2-like [Gastrolobium bilobum]|uniref:protein MAIN-LIKE 2-like n=1 Tax=Gastrolobium bilobum TaxID=150636 RepID=UPI002AAFD89C|nr:protein MAIN-LIKE 2-like [Gastrolobium bilobum]